MSLQSMFNQMIGNIGVQSSILKNRLANSEESISEKQKAAATANVEKEKRAEEIAQKRKETAELKRQNEESRLKIQQAKEKAYFEKQKIAKKDLQSLNRVQKQVKTYTDQVKELEARKKALEEVIDTSYGGAL